MKGLIFTYVMTYGGAFVALFNPFIGLLIYISFAILKPDSLWYWQASEMPSNASRIVAVALLAGWAMRGFGNWKLGRAWAMVVALGMLLVWAIASTLAAAVHQSYAWGWVEELIKILLPFLVGVTVIDSVAKLRTLAWVIVASYGYVSFELNMAYLGGFNRVADIGFGGMDNNCVGVAMNTGIGLAFFLGLSASRWWLKAAALLATLSMAHVVMLSFSRGGMLGLGVTGIVAFFLIRKSAAHYVLLAVLLAVGLRMAGPQVQERFFSSFADKEKRDASAESRVKLWKDCFDMAVNNPVTGVGPRHFTVHAPSYGWPLGKEAHTLWLQIAAELGFPGLAFLLFFYGSCVWWLWRLVRRAKPGEHEDFRWVACMVIASLIGFAFSAQFVSLIGLEAPYYVAMIGAVAIKLADRRAAEVAEAPPEEWEEAEEPRHAFPVVS